MLTRPIRLCVYAAALAVTLTTIGCGGSSSSSTPAPVPASPLVSGVTPAAGALAGGTSVTITGGNFASSATVAFGANPSPTVTFVSSTELVAVTPAGSAGAVNVVVTNPGALTGTLPNAFTYDDPPVITVPSAPLRAVVNETLTFQVTATDASANPVTLRLLNPPPGARFQPVVAGTSPVTSTIQYTPSADEGGSYRFLFRAEDATTGSVALATVTVDVSGSSTSRGLIIADVTGDGVLDVIGRARSADLSGTVFDLGAVYVWAGTTTPSATPTATLRINTGTLSDELGEASSGQGVICSDVTGDGVLDIVVVSSKFDVGTPAVVDAGAIHVWEGGAAVLTGSPAPKATLTVTGAVANDLLGSTGTGQAVLCCDVTGDATNDIVVGATSADIGGTTDTGAVYVWTGGSTLTGNLAPTATLAVTGATANDNLGFVNGAQGLLCCDVTGDGRLDIIAATQNADISATVDTGAIYVWAGGTGITGTPAPTATLTVTGAAASDQLGFLQGGQGILCCEVTGDANIDIIAGASLADVSATSNTGAIYVWAGGTGMTGAYAPSATLTVSGASAGDSLGQSSGQGILCCDVVGNGTLDIVAGSNTATVGGTAAAGAAYVWTGGTGLTGAVAPTATLTVASPTANDQIGFYGGSAQSIFCCDVTGNGSLDVIIGGELVDLSATQDVGAVYVWQGGTGMTGSYNPTATLSVGGVNAFHKLGWIGSGTGIRCSDVVGNGTLDVVVGALAADGTSTTDTGAVYVWTGGTGLTGSVTPTATLSVSNGVNNDQLCSVGTGTGLLCCDVTGDGRDDIVAGAFSADIGGVQDAGAVYVFAGATGMSGATTETAALTVSGAITADSMGNAMFGQGILCCDVTGDGTLDLVVSAPQANKVGTTQPGAVYVWTGGVAMTGSYTPTATLTVATGAVIDQLGNITAGQGLHCVDITGDGTLDLVVGAALANNATNTDTGAIYFWGGGTGLTGSLSNPLAMVVAGAWPSDRLGR